MEIFNFQFFVLTLALVGVVIIIAALLSGLIDRSDLPQVGVFLALGAMLGPAGLALLDVTLESPTLRVVATLSLVLVLFTDAVSLSIAEMRRHGALAFRVLGPGTLLSAGLIALAGWLLLGLPVAAAAILGAALASTDPVMLRGLLRRPGLPEPVRLALRLESGLNDAVLLPVVLVAMPFLVQSGLPSQTDWARIGLDLFLLGPGAGIAVGLLAIAALEMIRRKTGVRRDYESIYSLGVAFAAYAAAEAVHGSGFLAAFAAGLTIAALDVELCDCFLEYGQTTAEMTLLFTFVLFGSSLIWSGFTVLSWPVFLFAVAVVADPAHRLFRLPGRHPAGLAQSPVDRLVWTPRFELAPLDPAPGLRRRSRHSAFVFYLLLYRLTFRCAPRRLVDVPQARQIHCGSAGDGCDWRHRAASQQSCRQLQAPAKVNINRERSSPSPRCGNCSDRAPQTLFSTCARNIVLRTAVFELRERSGFPPIVPLRVSQNLTCRARPGSSHFALDRTKRPAPVWRGSYKRRVGLKRERWWVAGKPGSQPDYRLNRNRSSE